jgi:NhaP-type Na+/H+ or K+/H+ antiporter
VAGRRLRERLIRAGADDPVLQTLLCVLIPYAAYLAAEALHVSGVLAVVIAGLWAGGKEVKGLSIDGRRHSREVWRMLGYVFNGLVFVLLGLQLRHMLSAVGDLNPLWLAGMALALWALLMALRFGWVWASAHMRFRFGWGWAGDDTGPDWRRLFLTSWAAVRGSVTLATALSVPLLTAVGAALPGRELVVFLAASTIILTLAVNGVSLPWFIRRLHAPSYGRSRREEEAARAELARAGIAALEPLIPTLDHPGTQAFAAMQIQRYRSKIVLHEGSPEAAAAKAEHIAASRDVRLRAIAAERECLYRLHAADQINEETLLVIEEELDERERLSLTEATRG